MAWVTNKNFMQHRKGLPLSRLKCSGMAMAMVYLALFPSERTYNKVISKLQPRRWMMQCLHVHKGTVHDILTLTKRLAYGKV